MKKWIPLAVILTLSTATYAGFNDEISVAGGNYYIKQGSPVSKVVKYLGEPLVKTAEQVCTRPVNPIGCDRWSTIETWQYEIQFYDWYIRHMNGKVLKVWSVKQ